MNLQFAAVWQSIVAPRSFYRDKYLNLDLPQFRALYGSLLIGCLAAITLLNSSISEGVKRTVGLVVCQLATFTVFYLMGRINRRPASAKAIFDWTCFAGCAIIPATIIAELLKVGGFDTLGGLLMLTFSVYLFMTGAVLRFGISTLLAWLGVLLPMAVSILLIAAGAFLAGPGLNVPLTGLGGLDQVQVTTGSARDSDKVEIANPDRRLEETPAETDEP